MTTRPDREAARLGRMRARLRRALEAALPVLFAASAALAATPPALRGPIATMGDRTVDALDIQQAAVALADDPLKTRDPARWRRLLLDRCIDRELLAAEAERRGLPGDPAVKAAVADRTFLRLYDLVIEKRLIPGIEPTPALLDSLSRSGLYQSLDLYLILIPDDASQRNRREAVSLVDKLRQGSVRFDEAARSFSAHPSRGNGGHFGPVLVRDLTEESHAEVLAAKPGDVLGPYSGPYGHEIYKVGGFQKISDDSLHRLVRFERDKGMIGNYERELLAKYHFAMNERMVDPILVAAGIEPVDSILASLGKDGTRERHGVKPALGVIARVDGDSLTFGDFVAEGHPIRSADGRLRIRDADTVVRLAGHAFFRRLVVRDALARGMADDARVARELRLIRDEAATETMVERAVPASPRESDLRSWFDAHADRYQRPPARRVRAVAFATRDSAAAMLLRWNGIGISDSSVAALGAQEQPRATGTTLFPGRTATLTLFEGDLDPLSRSVRSLDLGMVSPVVQTVQGFVLAQVISREPARPDSMDEVIDRVRRDWREEKETEWVQNQLERIRAVTPVRIIPARLEAVKLGPPRGTTARGSAKS